MKSGEQTGGGSGAPGSNPAAGDPNQGSDPKKIAADLGAKAAGAAPEGVTANEQVAPGKSGDVAQGKDQAKVAATGPKPPAPQGPAKVVEMAATPWEPEMVAGFKRQFGSGLKQAATYMGQNFLVADAGAVVELLEMLRDDQGFDYLVDVTAVHYPEREAAFEVVWVLYSFAKNERLRVKTGIADGAKAPSMVRLWPTANWLEREVYDMFGIEFEGHPDMRRILLPDGWKGYPLRKEYGIIQQDKEWVQINLGIESGQ